jgi:hypothetical protein
MVQERDPFDEWSFSDLYHGDLRDVGKPGTASRKGFYEAYGNAAEWLYDSSHISHFKPAEDDKVRGYVERTAPPNPYHNPPIKNHYNRTLATYRELYSFSPFESSSVIYPDRFEFGLRLVRTRK